MTYWLFKTEPDEFSIDDLARKGSERWNGIRNYQARNLLRDQVKVGDQVLIYHSSCKLIGIAGTATISRAAYVDEDQFSAQSKYFDSKSSKDNPRWYCVDICFDSRFAETLTLAQLKAMPALAEMTLLRQGRLSIQPVTAKEWKAILAQAKKAK